MYEQKIIKIKALALALALAVAVFIVSGVITAILAIFSVLILAGPHGGMLPEFMHKAVLLFAWLVTIALPIFCSIKVYKRYLNNHLQT